MQGGGEKGVKNGKMRVSVLTTIEGVMVLPVPVRPGLDADHGNGPQRYSVAVVHAAFIQREISGMRSM
jgi:hypothetical protein